LAEATASLAPAITQLAAIKMQERQQQTQNTYVMQQQLLQNYLKHQQQETLQQDTQHYEQLPVPQNEIMSNDSVHSQLIDALKRHHQEAMASSGMLVEDSKPAYDPQLSVNQQQSSGMYVKEAKPLFDHHSMHHRRQSSVSAAPVAAMPVLAPNTTSTAARVSEKPAHHPERRPSHNGHSQQNNIKQVSPAVKEPKKKKETKPSSPPMDAKEDPAVYFSKKLAETYKEHLIASQQQQQNSVYTDNTEDSKATHKVPNLNKRQVYINSPASSKHSHEEEDAGNILLGFLSALQHSYDDALREKPSTMLECPPQTNETKSSESSLGADDVSINLEPAPVTDSSSSNQPESSVEEYDYSMKRTALLNKAAEKHMPEGSSSKGPPRKRLKTRKEGR
jgi:hypothetical protein